MNFTLNLETDIRFLKGVGEKRAEYLKLLGIDTVGALLRYYPRTYADFSDITDIFDCMAGEKYCVKATVTTGVSEHRVRKNMVLYKFNIADGTGSMSVTLFNNKYLANAINKGSTYVFCGKVEQNGYSLYMSSPEIRQDGDNTIHPIYRQNSKITSKQIEKLVKTALSSVSEIKDVLPPEILKRNRLCSLAEAIKNIHFPKDGNLLSAAKRYLVFEELFVLSLSHLLLKGKNKTYAANVLKNDYSGEFKKLLPYSLTNAQNRAIKECVDDMRSGRVMNRLVEGDVGSGKTAVAACLMYCAAKEGFQSAIMAPTEILAEQHFEFFGNLFKDTFIKVALLTGSTKKSEKEKIINGLKNGEIHIAVGTHALIGGSVEYKNLGLVITDEQHRFGVRQRAALAEKGKHAHTLVMSATPIPRTMGLIIYGDLDISIVDEYPKGRQKIDTFLIDGEKRERAYNYIKKHLDAGLQGYIVCPAVEETEESELLSAEELYNKIKETTFKNYRVGLLHGQLKAKEKDGIMREFKDKKIDLLVCTTVVEVGIDVPNAAIMVIENAERFGAATLHQLRGRVGRGTAKSTCILISNNTKSERLNVIKNNDSGFKIADEDLRLRGPGDFLGQRQHGLPELKIADLYADSTVLKLASMEAANLLENNPKLNGEENAPLKAEIINLYKRLNEN